MVSFALAIFAVVAGDMVDCALSGDSAAGKRGRNGRSSDDRLREDSSRGVRIGETLRRVGDAEVRMKTKMRGNSENRDKAGRMMLR